PDSPKRAVELPIPGIAMMTFLTRARLAADLAALGVVSGDMVMVHAAFGKVGPVLGGPDALIGALRDAVGAQGTVLAYADWDAAYEALCDADGRVPEAWKPHVPPFDAAASRAIRDNGVIPEFLRTTPGACRSASPGPSITAIGARAGWLTENHAIDYGYGEGTPLARLVEAGGKVLMVGNPRDTITLLHHAEHLARIPNKRIKRVEVPFATPEGTVWRMVEEFDTGSPVVDGLNEDYFADIVDQFLATGQGRVGQVGAAETLLLPAPAIVGFAVEWLEARFA
ncbi:TPA: aminoglycoside 3-N-acetyltransferase, partial [Pseudomonas aeruginosa]